MTTQTIERETMGPVLRRAMESGNGMTYEMALRQLHAKLAGTSQALVLSGKDARIIEGATPVASTSAPVSFTGRPGIQDAFEAKLAARTANSENGSGNKPGSSR